MQITFLETAREVTEVGCFFHQIDIPVLNSYITYTVKIGCVQAEAGWITDRKVEGKNASQEWKAF
jgi:hypothetical protein